MLVVSYRYYDVLQYDRCFHDDLYSQLVVISCYAVATDMYCKINACIVTSYRFNSPMFSLSGNSWPYNMQKRDNLRGDWGKYISFS